jgi:hypothetical protein
VQVQLDAKTVSLQVGNQGVDVRITDNQGRQVGTLRIGHATVEWRKGKIGPSTSRKLELSKFISEHLDVLGAAKPSAGRMTAAGPKRPVRPVRPVRPAKPSTGRATAVRRKRPEAATKPSAGRAATTQRKRPVTPARPSSPRATANGQRPGSRTPSSKSKTRR